MLLCQIQHLELLTSEAGVPLATAAATRMGFDAVDVEVLGLLVRHHLLLPDTATRRDLDDPATAAGVAGAVRNADVLALLHVLTCADAAATGPAAWSDWKAGLVEDLVGRVVGWLSGSSPPPLPPLTAEQRELLQRRELAVRVQADEAVTWTVTVVAPDRIGLFAMLAGVLALHRLSVRSAQLRTESGMACDVWTVVPDRDHEPRADAIQRDIVRAQEGDLDLTRQLDSREASRRQPATPPPPPRVDVVEGASESATVVEVRASDRLGLLCRLGRALALMGVSVRAARVSTLGAEAVDVFYLVDASGQRLDALAAREVVRLLTDAAG